MSLDYSSFDFQCDHDHHSVVEPLTLGRVTTWVQPPLSKSNSWTILVIYFLIALNTTPNIDCYRVVAVGAVSKL